MLHFERSRGAEDNTFSGLPIVLMTCVGAASGKLRKVPLKRVEHEGEYAAIASYGGRPAHPAWYHNLKAHPRVEVHDGPLKREYVAREVTVQERARWWERAVAAYAPYVEYQTATTREIPVFVLTPVTEQ